MKQQISYSGPDSLKQLVKIIVQEQIEKLLVVCHENSFSKSGAKNVIEGIKDNHGLKLKYFHDYQSNPTCQNVKDGLKQTEDFAFDAVLAVGGGSALDTAKLINAFSVHQGEAEEYIKGEKELHNEPKPLITVPTTVGTGTESTRYSVIYLKGDKHTVTHQILIPDYYILDPKLTMSLPEYQVACSGMDALCQGIEAFWNVNSTPEAGQLAEKAINLVYNNLKTAVNQPDLEARYKLLSGANFSGKAINTTRTTAAHSCAYKITTKCGIPHGHAVALNMVPLLEFNYQNIKADKINDSRGVDYVENIFDNLISFLGADDIQEAKGNLKNLMTDINLATDLNEICEEIEVQDILDDVNVNRLGNNPVKIKEGELRNILSEIIY